MKAETLKYFSLQFFVTNKTTDSGLSPENKTFYEKTLIDEAEPKLVYNKFGDKYPIPKNGGKSIEFRKFTALPKAMTPISEGVTPEGNTLNVTTVTATVNQYGDFIRITDIVDLTTIDNVMVQATKLLGSQAGRTLDSITRDILMGGTNVLYAGEKLSRATLTMSDKLDVDLFNQAAAILEAQNADYIDDSYVAIIHPYAKYDLISSEGWIDVHKYADPTAIYKGEIGKLGNIRFIASTEAKVWKDETCPSDGNDGHYAVFGTLVIGAHAYGVTDIEGGGLEQIIKPLGSGEDPLNQRASSGWKATATAERLVEPYMLRIESLSKYSSRVQAN